MTNKLKVVFMGTPAFALPTLQALIDSSVIEVCGVMTQPDKPSGRGQKLTPPPVKLLAEENQLPVLQPVRLRKDEKAQAWLKQFEPDFLVTAAFGQILPQSVLDIPKYGVVNIHASLLPKYRGANPIQWAILNDENTMGITTMLTVLEVDAGDMLVQREIPIEETDTALTMVEKMANLGGQMIVESLQGLASGSITPTPQDATKSTHAPKLEKEDAQLDWNQPARSIFNKVRGQQPWPGVETILNEQVIKINQVSLVIPEAFAHLKGQVGEVVAIHKSGLLVQAKDGLLLIQQLQPPGKPKMLAADWANGGLRNLPTPWIFETPKVTA